MRIITVRTPEVKPTRTKPHFNRPFGEGVFTKRQPFTVADQQWWADNHPSRQFDYCVLTTDIRLDRLAEESGAQDRLEAGLML